MKPHVFVPIWESQKVDMVRCRASVHDSGRGVNFHQCFRKGTIEIDGKLFCAQHAKMFEEPVKNDTPKVELNEQDKNELRFLLLNFKTYQEDLEQAKALRDETVQSIANLICPYKVGDETTVKGCKYEGKRCRITDVRGELTYMSKTPIWKVKAVILNKDGSESYVVEWSQFDERIQE